MKGKNIKVKKQMAKVLDTTTLNKLEKICKRIRDCRNCICYVFEDEHQCCKDRENCGIDPTKPCRDYQEGANGEGK